MASAAGARVSAAPRVTTTATVQGSPDVLKMANRVNTMHAVAPATVSPEAMMMCCTPASAV